MASEKVVVLSYLGTWLGGLVLTAVAFWLTRTLARPTRTRALVMAAAASFTPSFIVLKFNGVVSAPELIVLLSTLSVYALLVGGVLLVLIRGALRFWRPKKRQHLAPPASATEGATDVRPPALHAR